MTVEPEYKLYVGVSGRNAGVFDAGSVWATRLGDPTGETAWTNADCPVHFSNYNPHDAYFYAVQEALPLVPKGGAFGWLPKRNQSFGGRFIWDQMGRCRCTIERRTVTFTRMRS